MTEEIIENLLNEKIIENVEIQILKRINEGYTNNEILEEMRDSFSEMFEDRGVAKGKDALVAGKKLTLEIVEKIKVKRNIV